ncbi:hypothetical protein [Noviherbaspirillum soli]|uniref:hypothetical protein n=1 Tax=Noviherbaspirillum soli TaxID=1064518 RepID=UPI00188B9FAE|nr:hypothetical protein [Noviherbaspirillum soli]
MSVWMLTYAPRDEDILSGGCIAIAAASAAIHVFCDIAAAALILIDARFSQACIADSGAACGEAGTLLCFFSEAWKTGER